MRKDENSALSMTTLTPATIKAIKIIKDKLKALAENKARRELLKLHCERINAALPIFVSFIKLV